MKNYTLSKTALQRALFDYVNEPKTLKKQLASKLQHGGYYVRPQRNLALIQKQITSGKKRT